MRVITTGLPKETGLKVQYTKEDGTKAQMPHVAITNTKVVRVDELVEWLRDQGRTNGLANPEAIARAVEEMAANVD